MTKENNNSMKGYGYADFDIKKELKIKTIFKGEFVLVDIVDETIELTVENNETYSQQMQNELEPIQEPEDEAIKEEVVKWMTEGTSPLMPPRSDCG